MNTTSRRAATTTDVGFLDRLAAFNAWTTKHNVWIIVVVVVLSYFAPAGVGEKLKYVFFKLPVAGKYDFPTLVLQLLMLAASINCNLRDFKQLPERPRAMGLTLFLVYCVIPLIGYALGQLGALLVPGEAGQEIRAGIVLLSLMPSAKTTAIWVRYNLGNVPLMLAMLMLNDLITVVVLPFQIHIIPGVAGTGTVQAQLIVQLIVALTVPMLIGITLRTAFPKVIARLQPVFALVGTVSLMIVIATNVAGAKGAIGDNWLIIVVGAILAVAMNLAFYVVGVAISRRVNLAQEDALVLIFCGGLRSIGTTLGTAHIALPTQTMVGIPAAVYCISQQVVAGYVTKLLLKNDSRMLGDPIGLDETALEQRLKKALAHPNGSGTGLLVFRLASRNTQRLVNTIPLVANHVRRLVRSADDVSFLPPDGFAVVLNRLPASANQRMAAKITAKVESLAPDMLVQHGSAHTDAFKTPQALIEAADNAAQGDPSVPLAASG